MKKVTLAIVAVLLAAALVPAGCGRGVDTAGSSKAGTLKYVDTHVHLGAGSPGRMEQAATTALTAMDDLGVPKSLILPPPRTADRYAPDDYEPLAAVAKAHPGRFGFLAGGGSLNPLIQRALTAGQVTDADRKAFTANADAIASAGAAGYGEMTTEHFSLGPDHPYESAPPDHPLFLLLADIAAVKNMPIDIHMEAVPGDSLPFPKDQYSARGVGNPETLRGNIAAFERLLAHNRKTKIIWDHVGWDHTGYRTPEATAVMLEENPNLYMSIKDHPDSPGQNRIMKDGVIKPEWMKVFEEFPDRFVLGSDQFYMPAGAPAVGPGNPGGPREILDRLPEGLAAKFAYENANALFGLEVAP